MGKQQKATVKWLACVLLSQSILRLLWLWSNGHCYEGPAPTVMYSTEKTLKHIPLTHTSLNPRLVFNYTLILYCDVSNKLFDSYFHLYPLLSTDPSVIFSTLFILESSWTPSFLHPILYPNYQKILAVLPFQRSPESIYFSLSPLQTSWLRTSIISHLLPY